VRKGILAGLAAGALWGLVFVAPRMTPGLSSVDLAAGRFVSYGAMSALMMGMGLRARPLPTLAQAAFAVAMSVLGFTGYYLLIVLAVHDIGTELPTLIIGTIPLWLMLLARPHGLRWAVLAPGLILTAAGLLLMMDITHAASVASASAFYWRGIGMALLAMLSWTVFALLNSAWLKRHPEVNATAWANWLGLATGLGALLMWLIAGTDSRVLLHGEHLWLVVLVCIATGIGSAWGATILWNVASQRLSASLCGQLIVSETLFALLYSFAWDGVWPGAMQAAAAVLFTLGIMASIRAHQ
jgi:drug/metabolite transporter (DMT)-like permease